MLFVISTASGCDSIDIVRQPAGYTSYKLGDLIPIDDNVFTYRYIEVADLGALLVLSYMAKDGIILRPASMEVFEATGVPIEILLYDSWIE